MLIALFSDIHANREAFEACLAHATTQGVQRYVFLGDIVGYGADPAWALETVMAHVARGAIAVRGNHDDAIVSANPRRMNATAEAAIAWTRTKLDQTHRDCLSQLPMQVIDDDRLFVHASADEPERWHYVMDEMSASASFAATDCRQTFCGHIHVPQLYRANVSGAVAGGRAPADTPCSVAPPSKWLAVLGAVGQPRDDDPRACYGLLDAARDEFTFMRVPYDILTASRKIRAAELPEVLASRLLSGT